MDMTVGKRLGPYEIVSHIGAGGMGEVYRARDTRLDRSVAIKVLATNFAGREDLRARFDREARTISQLNHPNICTLYDIGHEEGTDFLVMELLEGDTLPSPPPPQVLRRFTFGRCQGVDQFECPPKGGNFHDGVAMGLRFFLSARKEI